MPLLIWLCSPVIREFRGGSGNDKVFLAFILLIYVAAYVTLLALLGSSIESLIRRREGRRP